MTFILKLDQDMEEQSFESETFNYILPFVNLLIKSWFINFTEIDWWLDDFFHEISTWVQMDCSFRAYRKKTGEQSHPTGNFVCRICTTFYVTHQKKEWLRKKISKSTLHFIKLILCALSTSNSDPITWVHTELSFLDV